MSDKVYQSKNGSWYARVNGCRQTLNTRAEHNQLFQLMQAEANEQELCPDRAVEDCRVIILRGLPGSGKTTWAREFIKYRPWYRRVSRDALREMLGFGRYDGEQEKLIRTMQSLLITELLREGRNVVVDNTNLRERDVREIKSASVVYWEGKSYLSLRVLEFHTPLEECIRRDALQPTPVGAERIREMAEQSGWGKQKDEPSEMAAIIERLMERPSWALDGDD